LPVSFAICVALAGLSSSNMVSSILRLIGGILIGYNTPKSGICAYRLINVSQGITELK